MNLGENKRRILLHTVAVDAGLPEVILWKDEYLSENDFELILGYSFDQRVKINLAKVPHLLIGGSMGSGKDVLLKSLLMQSIKKGAAVYISDFKGGVDFAPIWHEKCTFITEETGLLNTLTVIVQELENRKHLLKDCGCGRADNILSQIILDNADAADKIPKDSQGLFLNHEGTIFRGYLFDENILI